MTNGIKPVGNWKGEIKMLLRDALQTSIDVCGRTGAEACKHAIILMAQSASRMTPKAKKNRQVLKDMRLHGAEYVEKYKKRGEIQRLYKFQFSDMANVKNRIPGTWKNAKLIGNRGLASRSWMWGLGKLGKPPPSKPMRGVTWLSTVLGKKVSGYILTNSLSYILKIMPAGWQASVAAKAGNRIMVQAKMKLERNWKREIERHRRAGKKVGATLSKFFLKV